MPARREEGDAQSAEYSLAPVRVSWSADPLMTETHTIALAAITLLAAIVNGALGYGFSSITVPLALLFLSNRVLNPALVLIEVPLNAWTGVMLPTAPVLSSPERPISRAGANVPTTPVAETPMSSTE